MLKTYLDLMHSFPPCKLLQFSFDLDLVETLCGWGKRTNYQDVLHKENYTDYMTVFFL